MFRTHMGTRTSFGAENRVLRAQTKTIVYLQSGTMCICHHPVHAVNTHQSIILLSPTAASTIQAPSLLHFEMGAMGSSLRLGICGKFHLQCHRIYRLHTGDTAFCWGRANRLGLGLPVLGFSVLNAIWVSAFEICGRLPSSPFSKMFLWAKGVRDPEKNLRSTQGLSSPGCQLLAPPSLLLSGPPGYGLCFCFVCVCLFGHWLR